MHYAPNMVSRGDFVWRLACSSTSEKGLPYACCRYHVKSCRRFTSRTCDVHV